MNDSNDDSSDSSNDFTGITPKDELTASFFSIKPTIKPNLVNSRGYSEDESSDDDNFTTVENGIDLFSEVVKNLEASQKAPVNNEKLQQYSKDDKLENIKRVKIEKKKDNISDEINAVLLQGESKTHTFCDDESTDEEKKEEEEVKRPDDYTIPKEGVKITLPDTCMVFKKKTSSKKETDLTALLRRKLKANQIIIEKVARLCWLAYGFYLNRQANDPELMAITVSLMSTKNYPKDGFNLTYLAKFTKWFKNMFTIESTDNEVIINKETLLKRIAEKKIFNYRELVILYVAILRGIGLHCRLIVSLNPPLVKSYNDLLPKTSAAKKNDKVKEESKEVKRKTEFSKKDKKNADSKEKNIKSNDIIQNSESARKRINAEARKKAAEILRSKYSYTKKKKDTLSNNVIPQDNPSTSQDIKAGSENTSSERINTGPSPRRLRSSKAHDASAINKQQSNTQTNRENNKSKTKCSERLSFSSDSSSEEDEEPPSKRKKKHSNNTKTIATSKHKNEKTDPISDDEETDNNGKLKKRQDVWIEVYVESKQSWISINIMDENVDCVADIYVSKKTNSCIYFILILIIVQLSYNVILHI